MRPKVRPAILPGAFDVGDLALPLHQRLFRIIRDLIDAERDRRSGFLWLPFAFGLGILAYFHADREPAMWAGPVLAILLLPGLWLLTGAARLIAISLFCAALGFSAATWRSASIAAPMLERPGLYDVTGFVEQVDQGPRRHRLTLRPLSLGGVETAGLPKSIRVGGAGIATIRPGEAIAFRARLSPPSEAAMPGGYDFRREAYFRQVGASGFVLGRITLLETETKAPLDLRLNAMIDDWRNRMTERISRVIGGEAGALAAALVTGKRGLIPEDTNEELRASGLYHIVSISGLHMVLAAGIFFWLARAMLAAIPTIALRYPIKKIAAAIAMVGATFYCIFSGSEVATERSLVMTLVMLGAILFDRPALAMRNLAISALIVLAREPEALLGPSFQMSFAAVACLIAANDVWRGWTTRRGAKERESGLLARGFNKLAFAFLGILATTIVASLATAPFGAWHFHRMNPLGVIGNALAIPLVSLVVMPSAVIGTLLLPFGLDGLVWSLMGEGVRGVLLVAGWVAAMDFAVIAVPRTSLAAFLLTVIALLVFTCLATRLRWLAVLILVAALPVAGRAPLPDLVIDAEARMALIRGEGGAYRLLAVALPSSFTLQQWLPALGDNRRPNDPTLRAETRCDREGCIGRLGDGRIVALATSLTAAREDCGRADIVITPLTVTNCAARLVSRDDALAYGAMRVITRSPGEWQRETALDPEIHRPWRKKPPERATQVNPPQAATRTDQPPAGPAATLGDDPKLQPQ